MICSKENLSVEAFLWVDVSTVALFIAIRLGQNGNTIGSPFIEASESCRETNTVEYDYRF